MDQGISISITAQVFSKQQKPRKNGGGMNNVVSLVWMGGKVDVYASDAEYQQFTVGQVAEFEFEGRVDGFALKLGKLKEVYPVSAAGAPPAARKVA